MSQMQRAVQYDETGSPDVLHLVDVPIPEPKPGRVLVRTAAVGVNPFDGKARSGRIPMDAPFPRGLGGDLAGTVTAVTEGAAYDDGTPVAVGDEVLGWGFQTLREYVAVPTSQLTPRPAALDVAVAGSLNTPGQTAVAVLDVLPVGAGDTVFVSGASGAVGFLFSQLAVQRGARVIGTSGPANADRLRAAGIEPIAYGDGLRTRLEAAAPDGVTAVLDAHGRDALDLGVALGVPRDRIAGIVDHAAVEELGAVSPGRYERRAAVLADLAARIADGSLSLPVQQTFSLDEVADAFALLESGHLTGKVVVTP